MIWAIVALLLGLVLLLVHGWRQYRAFQTQIRQPKAERVDELPAQPVNPINPITARAEARRKAQNPDLWGVTTAWTVKRPRRDWMNEDDIPPP